jgi:simple sugar transport system ATP-binding protein
LKQNQITVLEMRGIVKCFPGVVANDGVDFELYQGEIHALLGENGAGKSTLMNVLYGLYSPDEGEVNFKGKPAVFKSARDAINQGLGMVHQHFMLVQPFTVAENIILGQPSNRGPLLEDKQKVYRKLKMISDQYGLNIEPDREVWTLSVGEQQRVEILKALYRGADVLILDEPTAVLTPQEAESLLAIMRRLAEEGKSVVFISHKLEEVLSVSDRITVLRDGKAVDTVFARDTEKCELAKMMVGREVLLKVPKEKAKPNAPLLSVKDLRVKNDRGLPALNGVSFEVRGGEILGIAGVAGNGQLELEEAISGLRAVIDGKVSINGQDMTNAAPKQIGEIGLAHIPSDRYRMGLLSDFKVAENLFLQRIGDAPFTTKGWLNWAKIEEEAERLVENFDVRTPSVHVNAGKLSGGNAQKVVLARELERNPKVLIAGQPTRGLDINAIEYVHRKLIEQRDQGVAILLISTELDEILTLSDRIAVFYEGQIMAILDSDSADIHDIGLLMAGSQVDPKCEEKEAA